MTRILRVEKQKDFTTIDNRYVRDKRLSWQAKGLLVYILTLPDNWKIYPEELRKHATDGISATRSALKELRDHGYLELKRIIDERGKVVSWEYLIHESPIIPRKQSDYSLDHVKKPELGNPQVDKPEVDCPHVENRTLLNTNSIKDLSKEILRGEYATYAQQIQLHIRSKLITSKYINEIDMKEYTNISDIISNIDVLNKDRIDLFFKERKTIKPRFLNADLMEYASDLRRRGKVLSSFVKKPEYKQTVQPVENTIDEHEQGKAIVAQMTKRIQRERELLA